MGLSMILIPALSVVIDFVCNARRLKSKQFPKDKIMHLFKTFFNNFRLVSKRTIVTYIWVSYGHNRYYATEHESRACILHWKLLMKVASHLHEVHFWILSGIFCHLPHTYHIHSYIRCQLCIKNAWNFATLLLMVWLGI